MNESDESSDQPEQTAFIGILQQLEQQRAEGVKAFAACIDRLMELQIEQVGLSYDGYADSGAIESVTATIGETEIELPEQLMAELTDAAENLLPSGWEINEGAFGDLILSVPERRLTREHNWRVSTTEYEEEEYQL